MLVGEYIRQNMKAFERMAAAGIVSQRLLFYADVNEWHVMNGCSVRETCKQFNLPTSTVIYINQRMSQRIKADDLH